MSSYELSTFNFESVASDITASGLNEAVSVLMERFAVVNSVQNSIHNSFPDALLRIAKIFIAACTADDKIEQTSSQCWEAWGKHRQDWMRTQAPEGHIDPEFDIIKNRLFGRPYKTILTALKRGLDLNDYGVMKDLAKATKASDEEWQERMEIERTLRSQGKLDGLSPEAVEALVTAAYKASKDASSRTAKVQQAKLLRLQSAYLAGAEALGDKVVNEMIDSLVKKVEEACRKQQKAQGFESGLFTAHCKTYGVSEEGASEGKTTSSEDVEATALQDTLSVLRTGS